MNSNEELEKIERERETDRIDSIEGDINDFKINTARSIHVKNNFRVETDPIDFENLVKLNTFVDKSLFIKQVFDSESRSVAITRPRR